MPMNYRNAARSLDPEFPLITVPENGNAPTVIEDFSCKGNHRLPVTTMKRNTDLLPLVNFFAEMG